MPSAETQPNHEQTPASPCARLFVNRSFFQVWLASLFINTAFWAFSLAVYWQTFRLTHSAFWVGTIVLLSTAPSILTAPVAGFFNDRFDRVAVAKCAAGGAFLTSALLGIANLLAFDSLLITALLVAIFGIFVNGLNVALASAYPSMVNHARLTHAVSVQNITQSGTQFLGSFLAFPLINSLGTAGVYFLCAGLSLLTVPALWRRPERRNQAQPHHVGVQPVRCPAQESPTANASNLGLSTLAAVTILGATLFVHCALTMSYKSLLPTLVQSQLRGNVSVYGTLLTLIGFGAFLGNIYLIIRSRRSSRRPLRFAIILSGLSTLALGLPFSSQFILLAGFLAGLSQTSVLIMLQISMQQLASEKNRGRIMGFYTVCTIGISAVFSWGYGGLAQSIRPGFLLVGSGLAFLLLFVLALALSSRIRRLFAQLTWASSQA